MRAAYSIRPVRGDQANPGLHVQGGDQRSTETVAGVAEGEGSGRGRRKKAPRFKRTASRNSVCCACCGRRPSRSRPRLPPTKQQHQEQ